MTAPLPPVRLIPRLDIKGENVVKGVRLEGLRVVGKPDDFARRYYVHGADEVLFIDIVASLYGRNNILGVVERAAREIFVPLTVGGGLRSLEDIAGALNAGADKVAINTAGLRRPAFLSEAAERFGSQCIVLNLEAKRRGPGQWEPLTDNGRETTGRDALAWVEEALSLGVGEILVTSVDQEGTRKGFDLELIAEVRKRARVPVIACGGAGGAGHVADCFLKTDTDAVACAAILHYGATTLPALKADLARAGIAVRETAPIEAAA
ncbi:MAG: imidazole glycerol phosphate synthase subunit HisF [Alphaproteobacteria bacterium]|nr:imidazole glycerol phosphate synthase subunit HisF [Alphaproteobacteria bacterium]